MSANPCPVTPFVLVKGLNPVFKQKILKRSAWRLEHKNCRNHMRDEKTEPELMKIIKQEETLILLQLTVSPSFTIKDLDSLHII